MKSVFLGLPFKVVNYYDRRLHRLLVQSSLMNEFDLVFIDHTFLTLYRVMPEKTPHVVCLINLEHRLLQKYASNPWGFRKIYGWLQADRTKKYEMNLSRTFDACIYVSRFEENQCKSVCPQSLTLVVPNGVDIETHTAVVGEPSRPPRLVYVGNYSNFPNVEAVQYFLTEIFPLIKKRIPGVIFDVVGASPPHSFASFNDAQVRVLGLVDDPRKYIAPATVVVIPLKSGGGSRLKILEAMGMGKAIVSTSVGADGLDLSPNGDIVIADSPEVFSDQVCDLVLNEGRRKSMQRFSRETAVNYYSWGSIAGKLDQFLRDLVHGGSPRSLTRIG